MRSLVVVLLLSGTSTAQLSDTLAARLITLPLKCVEQEYPNKLGQVLNHSGELKTPKELHPIFYGCLDWHSSVHGHWLMVTLLKRHPDLPQRDAVLDYFTRAFTTEKVAQELLFFQTRYNESFERTYGWAWFLKLQQELDTWELPEAQTWAAILRPYSDTLAGKFVQFLPKLVYPIRSGDHINLAFGLSFAHDYAIHARHTSLQGIIEKHARAFYLSDKNYSLRFEPSGYDFLSPGLEEADLMQRILPQNEFEVWLEAFLPELFDQTYQLDPGKVVDRTDGKLVHLDGLNFSRAWCLSNLARTSPRLRHLRAVAMQHIAFSLPKIIDGDYMGEHWLASFAVEALLQTEKK